MLGTHSKYKHLLFVEGIPMTAFSGGFTVFIHMLGRQGFCCHLQIRCQCVKSWQGNGDVHWKQVRTSQRELLPIWRLMFPYPAKSIFINVLLLCHLDGQLIVLLKLLPVSQAARHCPVQKGVQLIIVILHTQSLQVGHMVWAKTCWLRHDPCMRESRRTSVSRPAWRCRSDHISAWSSAGSKPHIRQPGAS